MDCKNPVEIETDFDQNPSNSINVHAKFKFTITSSLIIIVTCIVLTTHVKQPGSLYCRS